MSALSGLLAGKVGLVTGVANERSIAAGCARAFHGAGAELVLTCREKSKSFVIPVAKAVKPRLLLPLDVEIDGALESVFEQIQSTFGRLDFVLHSIAFCPKQDFHVRVTDCSREGFARAMDISVHSFIRMARLAEPLMQAGGCLLTVSHYGAEKVLDRYNIMGPVKAALEGTVGYLAAELGPQGIRVKVPLKPSLCILTLLAQVLRSVSARAGLGRLHSWAVHRPRLTKARDRTYWRCGAAAAALITANRIRRTRNKTDAHN